MIKYTCAAVGLTPGGGGGIEGGAVFVNLNNKIIGNKSLHMTYFSTLKNFICFLKQLLIKINKTWHIYQTQRVQQLLVGAGEHLPGHAELRAGADTSADTSAVLYTL